MKASELETECLFGETIKILDKHLNWYYCKLLTDNYHGWVEKKFKKYKTLLSQSNFKQNISFYR